MNKTPEEIVKEMQQVVEQMRLDDLEEDETLETEMFECDCCAKTKSLAGSIQYDEYRLCNDCVLLAETGFALGKITNIQQLMDAMEDKRLEELCDYIKQEDKRAKN